MRSWEFGGCGIIDANLSRSVGVVSYHDVGCINIPATDPEHGPWTLDAKNFVQAQPTSQPYPIVTVTESLA
jgi:hypothetical protein